MRIFINDKLVIIIIVGPKVSHKLVFEIKLINNKAIKERKMDDSLLPLELITEHIVPNACFETILSFYLSCKKLEAVCSQPSILSRLARKININASKITTFGDFVEYGSLMLGSSLAIKYHSGVLCKLSGIKFGNSKLTELAQKKGIHDTAYDSPLDKLLIAAAVEGDQLEKVLQLLDEHKENIDYAIIACLICNNTSILFVLLSKDLTQTDLLHIALCAIKFHRNNIYLTIHDRIKNKYDMCMKVAVQHGNIEVMEKLKACFCHDSNKLLRIAVYYNQLEAIKWLYNNYDGLVVAQETSLATTEVAQWLIQNKGYNNYKSLFKGSLTQRALARQEKFERIKYSYNLLVTSACDKNTISRIINKSLDIMPNLDTLKYLNELLPGILDFRKIGKRACPVDVFVWAIENGFDDFLACDYPFYFGVFKICAEKTNSVEYLGSVMENVETRILIDDADADTRKIFFYLLDKGIETSLTDETITEVFGHPEEDEPEEKICAVKFLTTDDKIPTLLYCDYPHTVGTLHDDALLF
jgi:hypothetical protein